MKQTAEVELTLAMMHEPSAGEMAQITELALKLSGGQLDHIIPGGLGDRLGSIAQPDNA